MRRLFFGGAVAGLLLGFGLGLALVWFSWPVSLFGADPAELRLDLKDDYLRMIASSYSIDGDMARALKRLGSLDLAKPDQSIAGLIRREKDPLYQQALIHFALDFAQPSIALARATFTPRPTKTRFELRPLPTDQPSSTPSQSAILARPTDIQVTAVPEATSPPETSLPDPGAPLFVLRSKTGLNCLQTQGQGLIEVDVQSANGRPQPGIGVEINWKAGDQIVYTGLKPERGMGYADLQVQPGEYNVRLVDGARSEVVENLQIDDEPFECTFDSPELTGWKLLFQQGG